MGPAEDGGAALVWGVGRLPPQGSGAQFKELCHQSRMAGTGKVDGYQYGNRNLRKTRPLHLVSDALR